MESLNFDRIPDLSGVSIPLATLFTLFTIVIGGKWLLTKAVTGVKGVLRSMFETVVSTIPVQNTKVATGYVLAGALMLGGATSVGYGISNVRDRPSTPQVADPEPICKEAMAKVKEGANPDSVDKTMKDWKEVQEKRYEAQKSYYETTYPVVQDKQPGVPYMTGGVMVLILGILLMGRTYRDD
jgi:hypothetical protein